MIDGIAAAGIEIPRTEALIHYDINLGQHFAQISLSPEEVALEMERQGLNEEQAAEATIFVSAETPGNPEKGEWKYGNHNSERIALYPVNVLNVTRQQLGEEATWQQLASSVSITLTNVTAHEISHYADDRLAGAEAVYAEQMAHSRRVQALHLAKYLAPFLVLGGTLGAVEVAAIKQDTFVVPITIGLLTLAACTVPLMRGALADIRHDLATDFHQYEARPKERRAREHEEGYGLSLLDRDVSQLIAFAVQREALGELGITR